MVYLTLLISAFLSYYASTPCRGVTRHFIQRDVFYRERAAGYYRAEAYSLSSLVVELPYLAAFVLMNIASECSKAVE